MTGTLEGMPLLNENPKPDLDRDSLTMEKISEAMSIIKALAPKKAPEGMSIIKGSTGLNIMKNDFLREDTIIVSKRLFDLIYEAGDNGGES